LLTEAIDCIKLQTKNMNVLIKKLLFLAKYDDTSDLKNMGEPVLVYDIIKQVVKEFSMTHAERRVVFKCSTNKKIYSDSNAIKQLLWIYADNAFKYTKKENVIKFLAKDDGEYVYLIVEDNGKGIEKENIPFLFDRFYRVDKSRNSSIGGNGLGLAIAKKIVSVFDGTVYVESEPNVRTAFINKFKIYNED